MLKQCFIMMIIEEWGHCAWDLIRHWCHKVCVGVRIILKYIVSLLVPSSLHLSHFLYLQRALSNMANIGLSLAFNVIEFVGLAGALVIIITAAVSPSIQRLPTWYMVLCSGAAYSFSMLLLAIARRQSGPEPDFALCVIQSALIYAGPIW